MVERFDLDEGGFLGERGRMVPDEFGDYVRVTDYADIERQLAEARAAHQKTSHKAVKRLRALWREKQAAEADNARFREALEPFAEAWDVAVHHEGLVRHLTLGQLGELAAHEVSGVHFRRARAALAGKE